MSRLAALFDTCRSEGRSALIGYLPTGFPDVPTSISAMTALVESGCDLVEVGIAYSDPGMDGPTIAAATEAALRGGVRVRDTLAAVEAISNAGGRAVVMTYWNPVLRRGVDAFARDLASAGGLGMITPDLIPDEADEWLSVSDIPVGVGLGVRSREQAAQIGAYADGVIVGSALVSALKEGIGAVRSLTEELADGVRQRITA